MSKEPNLQLEDATLLHPYIAKRYRHSSATEHIIGGKYTDTGIAVDQPQFGVYAKVTDGGIDSPATLRIYGPEQETRAWWMNPGAIKDVVGTLLLEGFSVTYVEADVIDTDEDDLTVHIAGEEVE